MNKLMPYFRLMKKFIVQILILTIFIVILSDGREILTGFKHSESENVYLIFKSEVYSVTMLLILIYGMYLSYKKFNVAMNIKADRKNYIKSAMISIIAISIIFLIFTILWSLILKFVVDIVSGKNAIVVGDSAYLLNTDNGITNKFSGMGSTLIYATSDLSMGKFIMNILSQFLNLLSISSIGFLIGSLLYRLKKSTSVIIFLVIPTVVIILGITFFIFNTDLFINYMYMNLVNILRIIMNVNIHLIIKVLSIIISLTSSVLLLKNAPIKEYAHDLI